MSGMKISAWVVRCGYTTYGPFVELVDAGKFLAEKLTTLAQPVIEPIQVPPLSQDPYKIIGPFKDGGPPRHSGL